MESPKKVVFESGSPSECLLSLNQQAAAVRTLALSWKILALLQMGSVTLGKSCYLFDRSPPPSYGRGNGSSEKGCDLPKPDSIPGAPIRKVFTL